MWNLGLKTIGTGKVAIEISRVIFVRQGFLQGSILFGLKIQGP